MKPHSYMLGDARKVELPKDCDSKTTAEVKQCNRFFSFGGGRVCIRVVCTTFFTCKDRKMALENDENEFHVLCGHL